MFEGFLPPVQKKKERRDALDRLRNEIGSIFIYEAPHHLKDTLIELSEVLGGDRRIALCREMTKKHEEVLRLTIAEAIKTEPRGEYVLVIEGRDRDELIKEKTESFLSMSVKEHVQSYIDKGLSEKDAMKAAAADRGISKRDIYNELKR